MRSVNDLLLDFHRACEEAQLPYVIVGGFAVMMWGEPRATIDADVLLPPDPEKLSQLARHLEEAGFLVDARDFQDAMSDGTHVTVMDPESAFHFDIKLAREPLERQEVDEAALVPFHGVDLRVARPEDTIAFKLKFGRAHDMDDVRSILARKVVPLDQERLERIAERLGVTDRLRNVQRGA